MPIPPAPHRSGNRSPEKDSHTLRSGRSGHRPGRNGRAWWDRGIQREQPEGAYIIVATEEECRTALKTIAQRLDALDEQTRRKHLVDRHITCHITDLNTDIAMRLHPGGLDFADGPDPSATQVRIELPSEDLVALTDGRLPFTQAWLGGRAKIEASVTDLLRLRHLL